MSRGDKGSLDGGQMKRREGMPGGHPWCPVAVWYSLDSITGKARVVAVGSCDDRPRKGSTKAKGIVMLSLAGHEPAQKRRDRPREMTEAVANTLRKCH